MKLYFAFKLPPQELVCEIMCTAKRLYLHSNELKHHSLPNLNEIISECSSNLTLRLYKRPLIFFFKELLTLGPQALI